jgi:hypothetical protein
MNILLLGGSNAGLHYGWAAQFQAAASEHEVSNQFLGAVGSLFGLLRLMEAARDDAPAPQLIVFEYALNDAVLMDAGWLRIDLLQDTLAEVMALCHKRKIRLLLLCLEPRPSERARVNRAVARVMQIYQSAARKYGLYPCLTLRDALGDLRRENFSDKHHLTEAASKRVAEVLAATIEENDIPTPKAVEHAGDVFCYTLAREARTQGPCRLVEIRSTVYRGEFLEISRSGSSVWPGKGLVVGLMLRSTQSAGVYRLTVKHRAYRKNAQSAMRDIVPKLILLHYSKKQPYADDDLEIAMPASEVELMRLPEDKTMLDRPCDSPFAGQILEIAGVMFWRKPAWPRRLLAMAAAKLDAGALLPRRKAKPTQ